MNSSTAQLQRKSENVGKHEAFIVECQIKLDAHEIYSICAVLLYKVYTHVVYTHTSASDCFIIKYSMYSTSKLAC